MHMWMSPRTPLERPLLPKQGAKASIVDEVLRVLWLHMPDAMSLGASSPQAPLQAHLRQCVW